MKTDSLGFICGDRITKIFLQAFANKKVEYRSVMVYDTDADNRKIDSWHKNILKFGTITNTLIRACRLKGTMVKTNWQ